MYTMYHAQALTSAAHDDIDGHLSDALAEHVAVCELAQLHDERHLHRTQSNAVNVR
jgi:hypothetical protein